MIAHREKMLVLMANTPHYDNLGSGLEEIGKIILQLVGEGAHAAWERRFSGEKSRCKLVEFLLERLPEREVDACLSFLESEIGRRYQEATRDAHEALRQYARESANEVLKEVTQ